MRKKGSITVFAALAMMLVVQLLFTLLEAARYCELEKTLKMNTDTVLESTFADYCSPLWETYRVLGMCVDNSQGDFSFNQREAQLRSLTAEQLSGREQSVPFSGYSLLTADLIDVTYEPYRLMTDQEGTVFWHAVSSYMKQNLVYEMAKSVYNNYEAVKSVKDTCGNTDDSIRDAMDALKHPEKYEVQEKAKKMPGLKGTSSSKKGTEDSLPSEAGEISDDENPLIVASEAKKEGILSLVLPKSANVSAKKISVETSVSRRSLEKGTLDNMARGDWYEKVLLNQYLVNYLGMYTKETSGRALEYEVEYLLGGKAKDADNLKIVAAELLAVREVLNMAAIKASPQKEAEASALALTLAGASANPLVIEAVKYGIIASWAFAESVLDVRTLLSGGKIAIEKSDLDWTSNVHMLPELLSGWTVAKDCPQGLDYGQYVSILLLFKNGNTLSMRAMDVQEAGVRLQEGYENFQMDHVLCETELTATYEFHPVFFGFVTLSEKHADRFRIQNQTFYSYFRGKEGT